MAPQRKDSHENPYGARSYLSPSDMTRVGTSLRFIALMQDPRSETDGVATQDWKSVHVTFYADMATYAGLVATFRPWRWYPKQPDGQSGATGVEVGRWIPDFEATVALDPARITGAISSHLAWPTRDATKMYFQLLGVFDAVGGAGVMPAFVSAQIFGDATQNDSVGVVVGSAGGGGLATPCCPPEYTRLAGVKATHWSPNDGAVIFRTAVQLEATATTWPFVVADANCNVLGIVVRKVTGVIVEYINGHNGVSISTTANLINITGAGAAPFAATDLNYYVYICYQDKAVMAPLFWAQPATHWTPNNGTATRTAATQVTTAGFPFVVDNANCHILGIVIRRASGWLEEYVQGQNGYRMTATADVISLAGAGAAPFLVSDLNYYLYVLYEQKAYTEASDSLRTEEIAPLNHEHTQPAYIVNLIDVSADPGATSAPSDDGIVMDGYKDIQFQMYLRGGKAAGGGNVTVTVTFQGSDDVVFAGARVWTDLAVGYDLGSDSTQASWTASGTTEVNFEVDFDNWMGKRIRARYDWSAAPDGAGAKEHGVVVIAERRKAL